MSEYVVIKSFTDKVDKHKYAVGDRYPYRGFAKKDRLEELSTNANQRGISLIAEVKQPKSEKKEETEKAEKPKTTKKKSTKE